MSLPGTPTIATVDGGCFVIITATTSRYKGHGTKGGRYRGGRAREIYSNDFHNTTAHGTGGIRSGVTITHDNTWDGVQPTHGLVLEAYRSFFKWKSQSVPNGWGGAQACLARALVIAKVCAATTLRQSA
jgi:hypothetical protein